MRATGGLVHKHYEVGAWLPHASLAPRVRTEQLPLLAAASYDVLPLPVRFSHAALVDSATGRAWPLANLP